MNWNFSSLTSEIPSWFSLYVFDFVLYSPLDRSPLLLRSPLSVFLVNIALYQVFSVQMDKFLSAVEKVQIVSKLFAIFSSGKIVSSLILRKKKKERKIIILREMNNTRRWCSQWNSRLCDLKIYPSLFKFQSVVSIDSLCAAWCNFNFNFIG